LLGMWEDLPDDSVSFSSDYRALSHNGIQEAICSISLSDNPNKAAATLNNMETDLQNIFQAISKGGDSLQNILLTEDFHFSAVSEDNPEIRLYNHLEWLKNGGKDSLSFAPETEARGLKTASEFDSFIQKVSQFLKPSLCIETRIQETLFAYTRADIDGDLKTIWNGCSTGMRFETAERKRKFSIHAPLHQRSVSFTLDSRTAMLQLLAQITAGAAALAVRFSLPGGAVTALPAAWRYIQDIMAQTKQITQTENDKQA